MDYDEKFPGQRMLSDMDHCRVVLRALAHFHAYSTIIQVASHMALPRGGSYQCHLQRDSEEPLLELWPFAVEAANFKVMAFSTLVGFGQIRGLDLFTLYYKKPFETECAR